MKVQVTAEIDINDVRVLQARGRLSAGMSARQAFAEEIEAVIQAHIETLESEAELQK